MNFITFAELKWERLWLVADHRLVSYMAFLVIFPSIQRNFELMNTTLHPQPLLGYIKLQLKEQFTVFLKKSVPCRTDRGNYLVAVISILQHKHGHSKYIILLTISLLPYYIYCYIVGRIFKCNIINSFLFISRVRQWQASNSGFDLI